MGTTTTFWELDAQVKEATKALQERERVENVLVLVNGDIARLKGDVSRAVYELKWKTVDLRKTEGFSVQAFYYRLRNRRKEWQEDVRYAHQQALSQYQSRKSKLSQLQAEREALREQLDALAGAQEQYDYIRQQQLQFILTYSNKTADLRIAASRLEDARAQLAQVKVVLAAGREAEWQLDAFTDVLKDPDTWKRPNTFLLGELWTLPVELFLTAIADTPESRLARHVRLAQEKLEHFQEELVHLASQFWPAPSIMPADNLVKSAQGWLYHTQLLRSRIAKKLVWLEKEYGENERAVQELDVELGRLIQYLWKAENF